MTAGRPKKLELDAIRIDGGTQIRAAIDEHAVADYADAIKAGDKLPAAVVYHDGAEHWLADGFHRYWAYRKVGLETMSCQVKQGTKTDALLRALGANREHGLRLSTADKRKAIGMALAARPNLSSRQVARLIGCSHHTVESERGKLKSGGQSAHLNKRVGGDGKQYPAHRDPPPAVPPDDVSDGPPDTSVAQPRRNTDAPPATDGPPDTGTDAAVMDGRGEPVTDDRLAEVFRRRGELARVGREISAIKSKVLKAIDGDPLYAAVHRQTVSTALDDARRAITRHGTPHAICHYCGGAGCDGCKGRGWLDIETYKATK